MARRRSGPLGGRPKTCWNACWYSFDTGDLCHSRVQVWMPHLAGINNREPGLLFKGLGPAVPKLRLVIQGVQNRRRIALANAAFYTNRGGFSVGEGEVWIMAGAARDSAVSRQRRSKKSFWPREIFSEVCGLSAGIVSRVSFNGSANLLKRLRLRQGIRFCR